MKTHEQLKTKLNEKFINAQVKGTAKLAPRPGYYFIRNLTFRNVGLFSEVPIVEVNWKTEKNDLFLEDLTFEIAISSLSSDDPEATKDLTLPDLVNKVIYVYHPVFIPKTFNGEEKQVLNCQWHFINETPKFLEEKLAGLTAFMGNASSLSEACENFKQTAPYDVAAAEELEAEFGGHPVDILGDDGQFEEIIEDIPNDDPIEDMPDESDDNESVDTKSQNNQ